MAEGTRVLSKPQDKLSRVTGQEQERVNLRDFTRHPQEDGVKGVTLEGDGVTNHVGLFIYRENWACQGPQESLASL